MESLSDIERDLRDRADCAERHGDRETHNDGVAMFLRSIADRIEAIDSADAWRSLYTPGNAAAMREALISVRRDLWDMMGTTSEALQNRIAANICATIRAALSAPARNCDKMPDIDNLTMHDLAKSPCKSTLECASREELLALVRWLLAPAAERKGEN